MIGEAEKKSWMALNTFRCPHLRADLSPESCKRNRQKPRLIFGYLPERFQPVPCSDCADWPALCRQVELRRAGASEEDAMEKAIKVCRECGKVKKIVGRRLCGACYMRLKKSGRLDQEYPLAPREARAEAAPGHPGMPEAVPDIRGCPVPEPVPEDGPGTGAHGEGPAAIDPLRCERYRECIDLLDDGDIPLGCPAAAGQISCNLYGWFGVEVDLARVPRLRGVIDERARENFRSPEAEILVLLRDALFKPVGPSRVAPGDHNALELHTRQTCERYRECPALPGGDIPLGCPAAAGQVSCDLYGTFDEVVLYLFRVPHLREVIDERARENFRSPEAEILVLLRDALFKPVGPSRVAPGDHNALELHTRQS